MHINGEKEIEINKKYLCYAYIGLPIGLFISAYY